MCGLTRFGRIQCSFGVAGMPVNATAAFDPVPAHLDERFSQIVAGSGAVCGLAQQLERSQVLCFRFANAAKAIVVRGSSDVTLLASAGYSPVDTDKQNQFCALKG